MTTPRAATAPFRLETRAPRAQGCLEACGPRAPVAPLDLGLLLLATGRCGIRG